MKSSNEVKVPDTKKILSVDLFGTVSHPNSISGECIFCVYRTRLPDFGCKKWEVVTVKNGYTVSLIVTNSAMIDQALHSHTSGVTDVIL